MELHGAVDWNRVKGFASRGLGCVMNLMPRETAGSFMWLAT